MHRGTPFEVAIQTSIFTRAGCERVMRFAFELARKRNKKKRVVDHQVKRPEIQHGLLG